MYAKSSGLVILCIVSAVLCMQMPAKAKSPIRIQEAASLDKVEAGRQALLREMEFVFIPGGCFEMGCVSQDDECLDEEKPVHEVCLDDFWMSKYEVTNSQYRHYDPAHNSKAYQKNTLNEERQPVVFVSWQDAQAFIEWLNRSVDKRGRYRLPTEAEWEYACRAGTRTARFWGDDSNDTCIYANVADSAAQNVWLHWTSYNCDDGFKVSSPVGLLKPNALGLYDILGNVWEWCEDIYFIDAYSGHRRKNQVYGGTGERRVCRGGSWDNNARSVRSASRYSLAPGYRSDNVGLRLVMTK